MYSDLEVLRARGKPSYIYTNDHFHDVFKPTGVDMEDAAVPEDFPFPFQPYGIQKEFMKQLYATLEQGAVGIFESPTGTVSLFLLSDKLFRNYLCP